MKDNLFIDSHVHITPPEIIKNTDKYRKRDPYFDLLTGSKVNKFITGEGLIEEMVQGNWGHSVVFGFAFQDMDLCKLVNEYTIEVVNKYPGRLSGYAIVNPLADGAEEELKRCYRAGLKGVGELFPAGQGFDITEKSHMEVVCDFCHRHDLPLLIHLNEPVGHKYPGKTEDSIREGAKLARNFPEVNLIYAHFGGGLFFYELMPEMKEVLENVYYDTAAQPFLYSNKIYETAKKIEITDKLLLGSDFPLISPRRYLENIKQTSLSSADIKQICSKNINRLC